MKNEIDPVEGKEGWNSSKEAVPGMTCMETAKWMSSFTSGFRAMVMIEQNYGISKVLEQAVKILQAQSDQADKDKLNEDERKALMRRTAMSIGQALVCIANVDPQFSGILASKALDSMMDARKQLGVDRFNDSIIRFNVRKVDDDLEISTDAVAMADCFLKQEKPNDTPSLEVAKEEGKITDAGLQFGLKKINQLDLNKLAKIEPFPEQGRN